MNHGPAVPEDEPLREVWVWDEQPDGSLVPRQTRMQNLIPGVIFALRDHTGETLYAECAEKPEFRDGRWGCKARRFDPATGAWV